jgi:hypothetical protein
MHYAGVPWLRALVTYLLSTFALISLSFMARNKQQSNCRYPRVGDRCHSSLCKIGIRIPNSVSLPLGWICSVSAFSLTEHGIRDPQTYYPPPFVFFISFRRTKSIRKLLMRLCFDVVNRMASSFEMSDSPVTWSTSFFGSLFHSANPFNIISFLGNIIRFSTHWVAWCSWLLSRARDEPNKVAYNSWSTGRQHIR